MRSVASAIALLRRLRDERAVVVLLFVLVGVTSLVAAAGPRLFNRVSDDGLRSAVARSTAAQRNLQFVSVDRFEAGRDDPFEGVTARASSLRDGLPASLRGLVDEDHYVVDLPRFQVTQPPNLRTYVTLRYQDGLDGRLDLLDGRWPAGVPPSPAPAADGQATPVDDAPRYEFALSQEAADLIGMAVGDTWRASVDPSDPVLRNVFPRPVTAVDLTLVGRFAVHDVGDPFWFDDHGLEAAAIGGSADNPIAFTTGLLAPDAYGDLLDLGLPAAYRWRDFVDGSRLDAGQLDALVPDLTRFEASYSTAGAIRSGATIARTGLLDIVGRYLGQRSTSSTALSIAALGPLTVAAAAVGLIGVLVVRRRRPALTLARARGASGSQLLAAQLSEGLLIAVPAGLAGLAVAVAAIPARWSDLSAIGVLVVVAGATMLLVGATWPVARRARRDLEREDPPTFRLAPRRLVFETLIVGVSLAVAWLLRQRGLTTTGASGVATGFDPLLAASPVVIGIAVALLTIRLYPLPVRGLGRLMARRRDLVPVLGLRNLGRRPAAGYLPLMIVMLTVAIGTFSSVVQVTIERSQLETSWREVGADFRVESPSGSALDAAVDPGAIAGAGNVTAALIDADVSIETAPGRRATWLFEAVDPATYPGVLADSPVAIGMPDSFLNAPTDPAPGTPANPIPVVLSTTHPNGTDALPVGATFEATIGGRQMTLRVEGLVDAFPGVAARSAFIVAPFPLVAAAGQGSPLRPTAWFVRGPEAIEGSLLAIAGSGPGAARVVSRFERFAALHDAPLVSGVVGGFAIALLVAMAYAAVAVMSVVVLHAPRRTREVALLRTQGLSDCQAVVLLVIEQGLPVLLAMGIGLGLGVGLAWFLAPGIDLAAFSDPTAAVRLQSDPVSLALVAGVVAIVVGAAVASSTWLGSRLRLAQVLRIGEP
jgi:putative ABC transport system permease protein